MKTEFLLALLFTLLLQIISCGHSPGPRPNRGGGDNANGTATEKSAANDLAAGSEGGRTMRPLICPDEKLGETVQDCPWSSIARELEQSYLHDRAANLDVKLFNQLLEAKSPDLVRKLKEDAQNDVWKNLWGTSLNFDEAAKGTIVHPRILDGLYRGLRVPRAVEVSGLDVQQAGVQHTYGYLFSTLKTPYGYKRSRWVSGELETAFGLTSGALGPVPREGAFLSNVTYFLAHLAFDRSGAKSKISKLVSKKSELAQFSFEKLKRERLVEKVTQFAPEANHQDPGIGIEIRTDLIWFPIVPRDSQNENSILLVYSYRDAQKNERLLTAFPVKAAFVEGLKKPAALGTKQNIVTRFNAYIPALAGRSASGSRQFVP